MNPSALRLSLLALVLASASNLAFAQIEDARRALQEGQYSRAEELAREAMKTPAHRADGAILLGRVQLETGRYGEAIRTVAGVRAGAKAARAREIEGEALLRTGKVREAIRALESAVEAAGDKSGWRARLLLARAHLRDGDVLAARPIFDGLADAYNDGTLSETDPEGLAAVASAVVALDYIQDGNETFAAATKLDPTRVETQTEWARLFLEKYDPGHAEECLRDALKANPHHAEAHLLMAKVRMAQGFNFVAAQEELEKALATNPNLTEAYAFRATMEVRDRLWEEAQQSLDRALAIDPTDPYALSVRAATYYIADDLRRYEQTVAKLRQRDPRYTGHIPVLSDLLEWEHRYEEIVSLNRQALRDDPSFTAAHGLIGINLLRMGEEDEGIAELEESWNHDRFNVLVFNQLNLYEKVISKEYAFHRHGPIDYRFHRRDAKILDRYLPDLLSRGYREMSKRYGVRPAKTKVEVFASEDHFARRSVGLPRVGVQGICFGRVVVAGGPRAAPINYGQVLWHELAHVFTIQLSRSRVPRWFTEGASVMEEELGSPYWVRDDDAALYRWIKAGRMPGVESLNTAFSRAKSGAEIGLAYYGSAKLVEHIRRRHGWPAVVRMLRLFGQGKRSGAVVREALKMDPDALDREFREAELRRLSRFAKNFQVDYQWYYDRETIERAAKARPNDAAAQGRAAVAALAGRDPTAAAVFATKAIKLDPHQPEARHVLADIAAASGDFAGAREHAQAIFDAGLDGYGLRLNLAAGAKKAGDLALARRELEAAATLDPRQVEPQVQLAKLAFDAGDDAAGIAALRRAVDLDPHSRDLHRELLERLVQREDWDQVREIGRRAIWNDPFDVDLHLRLARAYEAARDSKGVAFELESARLCEPEDIAKVHLAEARYHQRGRRRRQAIDAAKRAVAAGTASSRDAERLLEELTRSGR